MDTKPDSKAKGPKNKTRSEAPQSSPKDLGGEGRKPRETRTYRRIEGQGRAEGFDGAPKSRTFGPRRGTSEPRRFSGGRSGPRPPMSRSYEAPVPTTEAQASHEPRAGERAVYLSTELFGRVEAYARDTGVDPITLIRLWVHEKTRGN